MNTNLTLAPLMAVTLLMGIAPVANAFYLSTQANKDVHPSPIKSPSGLVAVSGSATAQDDGIPNQYPGNVVCSGHTTCFFGPVASNMMFGSYRFLIPMGCVQAAAIDCKMSNDTSIAVNSRMTWDQAISAWRARYGQTVSRTHAYSYATIANSLCTSWAVYSVDYQYLLPGADSCGTPLPPPNKCTVSGGTVDLNHGTLKTGDITGNKKDVSRQVNCLRAASIRYTVSQGNPVDLGNGINSSITVNGVPAGQTITLPAGNSSLVIASTLTDKGAKPGAFSKTVVLIQSFM